MIAIAGCVRFDEREADFRAREHSAPFPKFTRRTGRASFSFADADSFASVQLAGRGGSLVLVGEARLDNRAELAARLAVPRGTSGNASDCRLLLHAWRDHGAAALADIRGDYAFAVWDEVRGELFLVRGPLSPQQLFYRLDANSVAFASIPGAIFEIAPGARSLDFQSAAAFIAGLPAAGRGTFFEGIQRLPHAHVARIRRDRAELEPFWKPQRKPDHRLADADYAALLRERLDHAVGSRLRHAGGGIAAHLSAGRDSGAVATSAAHQLGAAGEPLVAFTAAPSVGFQPSNLPNRLDDESELAGATAALHANIRHEIIRAQGDPFADLDAAHAILPNPVGQLSNFPWWRDIERAAVASGIGVLLAGNMGNFALSAGGGSHLASVLHEEGMRAWARAARSLGSQPRDFARILNWTFGGRLAPAVYRAALRASGRAVSRPISLRLLRREHRRSVDARTLGEVWDQRPPLDPFEFRSAMIMDQDPTNSLSSILYGIDARDPTADRDLIDFCFTVPAHLLVGRNGTSSLFERAFAARLGWSGARPRGYQGADWDRQFNPVRVRRAFAELRAHPLVGEVLDLGYVETLLREWPDHWDDRAVMLHYRNDLLGAVCLAHFVCTNF